MIVQVDESLIAKRKNHQGRVVAERWIFGGFDTVTRTGFLEEVPNRRAETLLPVIQRNVADGSIIHSDCWAAYGVPGVNGISALPNQYVHQRVNHTQNFVDPVIGAHTNGVECMWKNCKAKFKAMHGVQTTTLASHLDEFVWRQQFRDDPFEALLLHIASGTRLTESEKTLRTLKRPSSGPPL